MQQQVFFVGSETEIEHHAAPLSHLIDYSIVPPESIVDRANPGDLAVFYSEHFDRFRFAVGELRKKNVATLYMIDGILEWRNAWENCGNEPACPFAMRPVLSDKVACIGPAQARVLNSWGNDGKVETVGIPRFDILTDCRKRKRGTDGVRLLVMTAKCPSYTDSDRENLLQCLDDLKRYLDRSQQDVEIIWRLTAELDRELAVENTLVSTSGPELARLLQEVDAVITTPSTAALEAMLLDLPTAIVDYNNCPEYVRSAWKISAADHLEKQIKELLDPPEKKLLFQRNILADELFLESSAAERMRELISGMLQISRSCIEQDQPLAFPDQVLNQVTPGSRNAFDHASVFPTFSEFKNDDTRQLQTELAHARREIGHLNRQIAQLRSELAEAHQIFDEINGHPIAGPVVRIRQKLINLLGKLKRSRTQQEAN